MEFSDDCRIRGDSTPNHSKSDLESGKPSAAKHSDHDALRYLTVTTMDFVRYNGSLLARLYSVNLQSVNRRPERGLGHFNVYSPIGGGEYGSPYAGDVNDDGGVCSSA